jgi:hypothetical protein
MTPLTIHSRPRRSLGLTLCQLAVPALAIPSALGIAKFFQIVDGLERWSMQGMIAAAGFELMNVGLSVLDIGRPELHQTVQRVRFWSVTTAILLNAIAHYGVRVPGLDQIDVVGGLLALIASVPLAVLYVALAGLLHAIGEGEHAQANERASLQTDLAAAREELATRITELAQARANLTQAREGAGRGSREEPGARGRARGGPGGARGGPRGARGDECSGARGGRPKPRGGGPGSRGQRC